MEVEIIKEYHKDGYNGVDEKFSIRLKYLKFINFYRLNNRLLKEQFANPTTGFMVCLLTYHMFILSSLSIYFFIKGYYIGFAYLGLIELGLIKWFNYEFRIMYDKLGDAEKEIKNVLKLKSLNKKVIQKYSITNNEIIIEKQKELK